MRSRLRSQLLGLVFLACVPIACSSTTTSLAPSAEPTQAATVSPALASSLPAQAPATTLPTVTPSLALAGSVRARIAAVEPLQNVDDDYYGIAADDTDVWVYDGEVGTLRRIATSTDKVVTSVQLTVGCQQGRGCGNVELAVPMGMSGGEMTVAFGVDDASKARAALG
jgi:hypothetical protein